jgi:hypothetical protein
MGCTECGKWTVRCPTPRRGGAAVMAKGLANVIVQTGRKNMRRIVFLIVALVLVFSVGMPSSVLAAGNKTGPPPVFVPVILDGIRYEPEEFNRINSVLFSNGVDLIYNINSVDGILYAFTTVEGYNEYIIRRGLPSYLKLDDNRQPMNELRMVNNSQTAYAAVYPYLGKFYEHINYLGAYLSMALDTVVPDLRTYNFNDRISSLSTFEYSYSYLYQDINYGGSVLIHDGMKGPIPSLVPYGWNDRISSIKYYLIV